MANDAITPAILSYIATNAYPDSDSIFSSNLSAGTLEDLRAALREERDSVKKEISSISRTTAPDIDSWITRANELQADILRSQETARQIVADAEACCEVKHAAEDQAKKVELLSKEVEFNEALTGTLEHIRHANSLLEKAREQAVVADVARSLATLEDACASIDGLDGVAGARTVDTLRERAEQLKQGMRETVTECWDGIVRINVEELSIKIDVQGLGLNLPGSVASRLSLEELAHGAKGLGIFEEGLRKTTRDLEKAIFRPRLNVDDEGQVAKVEVRKSKLSCLGKSIDTSPKSLFNDLRQILDFLSTHLPSSVMLPLSAELMPIVTSRLVSQWLDPKVPMEMKDIPQFQDLLDDVSALADHIDDLRWSGADALREWTANAPRAWLTKRREAVLGDVRNLVFDGLKERKVVERVETRVVSRQDLGMGVIEGAGERSADDDDWDTAWDEPKDPAPETPQINPPAKAKLIDEDVDEASAWEVDDDEDSSNNDGAANEDDTDAWGWGDDEPKPNSPVATKKHQQPPPTKSAPNQVIGDQEVTLRETFTVTAVPTAILSLLQSTIADAQSLAEDPVNADSSLAPAASALYTLPTLALAIYRATAPTAYAKLPSGAANLLIYNDASRLADQLRSWQAEQSQESRLRVDSDVAALEAFAKRAYAGEIDAQRTILQDLLDGAQGFAGCTEHPFKQECLGAVDAVVDRIKEVRNSWKGVLSEGALLQSLGNLVSCVTRKMIADVEELRDIGEAESKQLKLLCDRVLGLNELFIQHDPSGPAAVGDAGSEGRDMTFIYTPTWLKFQYLAEILDSSLADIRWMWKEGELSLEFGAEEVVELVEALFAESELRRQAIREVRRGG